jgi:signal transduction histidine kinase
VKRRARPAAELTENNVLAIFRAIGRNPYTVLVATWNWKAAVLSAAMRAPVFLLTTCGHGWRRAGETAFRVTTTGVFAAAIQAFRDAEPEWAALGIILAAIPLISLALDGLLHTLLRTPNLAAGMLISLLMSAISSLFNWYVMRRGALLMGRESHSFGADLRALPRLILGFLLTPVRRLRRAESE